MKHILTAAALCLHFGLLAQHADSLKFFRGYEVMDRATGAPLYESRFLLEGNPDTSMIVPIQMEIYFDTVVDYKGKQVAPWLELDQFWSKRHIEWLESSSPGEFVLDRLDSAFFDSESPSESAYPFRATLYYSQYVPYHSLDGPTTKVRVSYRVKYTIYDRPPWKKRRKLIDRGTVELVVSQE